jgi:nucleoid DNA-binding protein
LRKKEKIKMTKNEVLKAVVNKVEGASQKDIAVILDAFSDVITETLTANHAESVAVGKLGKFKVKTVPERRGKIMMGNRKGEEYVTPQHDEICFKMSKSAKQL